MALVPGALRKPTAAALTQQFWLLQSKPTAYCYVDAIGEPNWCKLRPCDHNGNHVRGGVCLNVPTNALDPEFALSGELSQHERNTKLLAYLLRRGDHTNDHHSLTASDCYPTLPLP